MKANTPLFIGFLFFDVAAVAFGVWQWWSVRPRKGERREEKPGKDQRAS